MDGIAAQLAQFAAELRYEDIPEQVRADLRKHMRDVVGVALAAVPLSTSEMARAMASQWGTSADVCCWGTDARLPASGAAFVNGVLAHSLDFDDTHLPSILHPSASVIPAALAVAEQRGLGTHDLLTAAAAGYEVCIRSGMAGYDRELGNSIFFERGWHATSICGTLGAATAAARLYGLNAEGVANALGIATSFGSGVLEGNRVGGSVKRLHCGWAAHAGIIAAQSAQAGFTAPATALEGRFGFYRAFCGGQFDTASLTAELGEHWSIADVCIKPYPANHFTHAGIEAALQLKSKFDVADIDDVELRVPTPTLRTIAEPREQKLRPESGYHAAFSGPFTVASALLSKRTDGLGFEDFSDAKAHDPRYLALAAKVRCLADSDCDAVFPSQLPAAVQIRLKGGDTLRAWVPHSKGSQANPMSPAEIRRKFIDNATRVWSLARAETAWRRLGDPHNLACRGWVHSDAHDDASRPDSGEPRP